LRSAHPLDVLRRVPTLVLTGSHDATIPADHSRRMAREIGAAARLVVVDGAGHMVNMTHPGAVNAALADLLEHVGSAAQARAAEGISAQ
jgi:pimeloyl-ACP methyl ester carboxylesterase